MGSQSRFYSTAASARQDLSARWTRRQGLPCRPRLSICLGAGGEAGVAKAIDILRTEIDVPWRCAGSSAWLTSTAGHRRDSDCGHAPSRPLRAQSPAKSGGGSRIETIRPVYFVRSPRPARAIPRYFGRDAEPERKSAHRLMQHMPRPSACVARACAPPRGAVSRGAHRRGRLRSHWPAIFRL